MSTTLVVFSFLILHFSENAQALNNENIVGGKLARIMYYPYHAYVSLSRDICNGAILSEWHIVTAAHCITDSKGKVEEKKIEVSVGTSNFKKPTAYKFNTHAKVVFLHKDFNPSNNESMYSGDIAILELDKMLPLDNPHRQKVALPEPYTESDSEMYVNTEPFVTGFGDHDITVHRSENGIKVTGKLTGDLRYAKTRVMSPNDCAATWPYGIVYFPRTICSRIEKPLKLTPKGTCLGDSGGPLVLKQDKVNTLIGILSYGPADCNEQIIPAVYTKVSYYRNFIDCVMAKKFNSEKICDDTIETTVPVQ